MYTLRTIKNLTLRGIFPPILVMAGLAGINSSAQADCFGYPESTAGCKINGVAGKCVGKLATGDIISVGGSGGTSYSFGCANASTSPLADTNTCVVRGLGGNDVIAVNSIFVFPNSFMIIVCGGGGGDIIQGADSNDTLLGDAGPDILIGGAGSNLLMGGSENDTLLLGNICGSSSGCFTTTSNTPVNFNFGGTGTRDVCQSGRTGMNDPDCEVKLP